MLDPVLPRASPKPCMGCHACQKREWMTHADHTAPLPTWDVLLRVQQIVIERGLAPDHSHLLVGFAVCEARDSAGSASEDAAQVRPLQRDDSAISNAIDEPLQLMTCPPVADYAPACLHLPLVLCGT